MTAEILLTQKLQAAAAALYGRAAQNADLQIQKTRRDFDGDYTMVAFGLAKTLRSAPPKIAAELGEWLRDNVAEVGRVSVVNAFLNIEFDPDFWVERLRELAESPAFGAMPKRAKSVMVEYSSPNTNKPLHLGHIRNNLLGYAVARILAAAGYRVIKVNLVNDRGIHICKSMLAWQKYGNGETPQSSGKKGDHLAGEYYVRFDREYKRQIADLVAQGISEDEAKRQAPIIIEAQEMLRQWEQGVPQVRELWRTMNGWVYEGFAATYRMLGVEFDQTYYESETYLLGKDLVAQGLQRGVFFQKKDGSVWIDLTADGLDQKLVQRADGTSVYITQDIGTAFRMVWWNCPQAN